MHGARLSAFRVSLALLAVCLAALAPATAKPAAQIYFLKDADVGQGQSAPLGDGVLSTMPPAPVDLVNPANNTPPSTRVIYPYVDAALPVQFVANATNNTGRISGVVAAYLFLPKTPAMQQATLNISLVALPAQPVVPPPLGGGGDLIAWTRLPLDYTNTTLPNATGWVPPNATNPQDAVNYTAAQLLGYGITTVYSSGAFVYLDDNVTDYLVDRVVPQDARLALRFRLEPGNATPPAPGAPVPVGAGQDIVYDFGLAFSLVLIPWYAADAPAQTTTTTSPTLATTTTTPPGGGTTSNTSESSPVLPFGIIVLLAIGSAWWARRRLA